MFFLKTVNPALFLIFLLVNSPFAQSVDESALALKKSGEAFRKPAGFETSDEQIQVGTWFSNFDSLRTAAASFLAILFTDDKSMLKMKENTRMTIQGNVSPTQSLRQVRIDLGALRTTINYQDKRKYEIITPVSVASVKGTDFWLTVDPNGTDTFIGLEGSVEILNIESGQSMLLTAGTTIISSWTGTMNINPTDPSTIPSDPDTEPEGGQGRVENRLINNRLRQARHSLLLHRSSLNRNPNQPSLRKKEVQNYRAVWDFPQASAPPS